MIARPGSAILGACQAGVAPLERRRLLALVSCPNPYCIFGTVSRGNEGPQTCPNCSGSGQVWEPDAYKPPTGEVSGRKKKIKSQAEVADEKTRQGALLIAIAIAVGTFLMATSIAVSGGALVLTSVVVFGVAYLAFAYPLANISNIVIGIVDVFFGAVRFTINVGMYLLGSAIIILIIYYALVAS